MASLINIVTHTINLLAAGSSIVMMMHVVKSPHILLNTAILENVFLNSHVMYKKYINPVWHLLFPSQGKLNIVL